MECASVSHSFFSPFVRCFSVARSPIRSILCLPFILISRSSLPSFSRASSTRRGNGGRRKKGGREDSLLCIRRQWHGPPHSSYLHSFNATWGLWNVHQPRGLRRAGPTVPLIPVPRMIVRWHSSLLQTLSLFRGKLSQSSIQIRLDTSSRTCRVNLDISSFYRSILGIRRSDLVFISASISRLHTTAKTNNISFIAKMPTKIRV